jgi:hypothetical protein
VLSNQAVEVLHCAGWSETYRYNISGYEKLYERAGCPLPRNVKDFMQAFGGLHITIPGPRLVKSTNGFDFDPIRLMHDIYLCSDYEFIPEQIGLPISAAFLIGSLHDIPAELLMISDGSIFAYYDRILLKIGQAAKTQLRRCVLGESS